jgi:hypothetical protein
MKDSKRKNTSWNSGPLVTSLKGSRIVAEVVRRWFDVVAFLGQYRATACEIRDGSSDNGAGFLYGFLRFSSANRHSTIGPYSLAPFDEVYDVRKQADFCLNLGANFYGLM